MPQQSHAAVAFHHQRKCGGKRLRKCKSCKVRNFCTLHGRIRLVDRDALEPCMWINRHIEKHYRPLEMPWHLCVKSIFQWNNETLNVWSHLVGFILLSWIQHWTLFEALPSIRAPTEDYLVMAFAMLCCQICMLLSTSYHIFGCHSPTRRKQWLRADLFGVSAALVGLYLSGLYTSFYKFPQVQRLYCTLIGAAALSISIFVPFRRFSFREEEKQIRGGGRRVGLLELLYVAMALVALAPTWHWINLHGGLADPHVQRWLPNLCLLFLLLAGAFGFYTTLLPERLFPGKFDLVGCSHQWWHLLVLAAMAFWHWSGIQLLTHYHKQETSGVVAAIIMNESAAKMPSNSAELWIDDKGLSLEENGSAA